MILSCLHLGDELLLQGHHVLRLKGFLVVRVHAELTALIVSTGEDFPFRIEKHRMSTASRYGSDLLALKPTDLNRRENTLGILTNRS